MYDISKLDNAISSPQTLCYQVNWFLGFRKGNTAFRKHQIEADIHAPCTDDKPTSSKKRVTPQACQVIEADTEKDSPKIVQVNVGDHVAIRHGKIIFPAMINRIDDHDDSVYWIQFFKEISNNKWSLEHKEFSAIHTDFLKILAPPDLVFESCSRFNYKFQDL
ncbi:unnamed protein product [Mytilus coruscus]|uniref:Uncharacterized protein n=1 Tax=Mytilus coruscus TaxID=42192 RepID=A0A6J8B8N7_MYTCO|nr:unnamed protein product [Mytilus coruscus]